jgi:uncharacterized repeat protein (TIGR03803 family)
LRRACLLPNRVLPLLAAISLLFIARASGQTDQTLYSFTGGADGDNPLSNLILDKAGNLYGTTFIGGAYGNGEVFELERNASGEWTEKVLYSFTGGLDGSIPSYGGVISDALGNLYGTTTDGGASNLGTVFELTPNGAAWSEKVLYSFAGGKDGLNPYAGLTLDTAGNLYGTTYGGGPYGNGTAFELTPLAAGQWKETTIHSFNLTNGDAPAGGVVLDGQGNLYGVTQGGGSFKGGTAYELMRSSSGKWTEKLLHSFGNGSDGAGPYVEQLVFDEQGNLYGTTLGGGSHQGGTVFKLSPSISGAWKEGVLYSFDPTIESNPFSGLIFDRKGNLYGTCANGNGETTVGAVFELTPGAGTWNAHDLFLFSRLNGEFPEANLVMDASGNLYGTTELGGVYGQGVVFELVHSSPQD